MCIESGVVGTWRVNSSIEGGQFLGDMEFMRMSVMHETVDEEVEGLL